MGSRAELYRILLGGKVTQLASTLSAEQQERVGNDRDPLFRDYHELAETALDVAATIFDDPKGLGLAGQFDQIDAKGDVTNPSLEATRIVFANIMALRAALAADAHISEQATVGKTMTPAHIAFPPMRDLLERSKKLEATIARDRKAAANEIKTTRAEELAAVKSKLTPWTAAREQIDEVIKSKTQDNEKQKIVDQVLLDLAQHETAKLQVYTLTALDMAIGAERQRIQPQLDKIRKAIKLESVNKSRMTRNMRATEVPTLIRALLAWTEQKLGIKVERDDIMRFYNGPLALDANARAAWRNLKNRLPKTGTTKIELFPNKKYRDVFGTLRFALLSARCLTLDGRSSQGKRRHEHPVRRQEQPTISSTSPSTSSHHAGARLRHRQQHCLAHEQLRAPN